MKPDDFYALADVLDIKECDVMLVGDGSGTQLGAGAVGWQVAVFSVRGGKLLRLRGGATSGTNNYAELMPYVHALWHLESARGKKYGPFLYRVAIVSDSELTVKCGRREYHRQANLGLWAAVDYFETAGFKLSWHWVPRNSNPISEAADGGANAARKALEGVK